MTLRTATLDRPITAADLDDFPPDGTRREVIGGTLYVAAAPLRKHQRVLSFLHVTFFQAVEVPGWGEVYFAPVDVRFSPTDQVQPDLIVLSKVHRDRYQGRTVSGPPDVVVEVLSPATRLYDQTQKRALYEAHGVPEYWMADPDARALDLLALRDGVFVPVAPSDGGILRSTVVPGLAIDPAALFAVLDR